MKFPFNTTKKTLPKLMLCAVALFALSGCKLIEDGFREIIRCEYRAC
ncbi:MAG: hypothetical protein V4629_10965 [Pseudomonadota bacterium]